MRRQTISSPLRARAQNTNGSPDERPVADPILIRDRQLSAVLSSLCAGRATPYVLQGWGESLGSGSGFGAGPPHEGSPELSWRGCSEAAKRSAIPQAAQVGCCDQIAAQPRDAMADGKVMGLPGGHGSPIERVIVTVARSRARLQPCGWRAGRPAEPAQRRLPAPPPALPG
jgi:hypothetical protein